MAKARPPAPKIPTHASVHKIKGLQVGPITPPPGSRLKQPPKPKGKSR